MYIYQDIARLADEIGQSPDFVITVCFWLTLLLGVGVGIGGVVLVMWFRH